MPPELTSSPSPVLDSRSTGAVVGLTGSIAAGKSTVARLLAEQGARVLDVDRVGHDVLRRSDVVLEVARRLGSRFLEPDGSLDRVRLAAEVFRDAAALAALEAIVHPRVRDTLAAELTEARTSGALVVLDAALLFEGGLDALCDLTVFVDAPAQERRRRTVEERGWEPEELDRRAARQLPVPDKRARADLVVENDADLETLAARVRALLDHPRWPDPSGGAGRSPELEETR